MGGEEPCGRRLQRLALCGAGGGQEQAAPWVLARAVRGPVSVSGRDSTVLLWRLGEKCHFAISLPRSFFLFIVNCCISLASIMSHLILKTFCLEFEFNEVKSLTRFSCWLVIAEGDKAEHCSLYSSRYYVPRTMPCTQWEINKFGWLPWTLALTSSDTIYAWFNALSSRNTALGVLCSILEDFVGCSFSFKI